MNTTLRNWAQRHKGEVSKRSDIMISFVLNQTNQRSCEGDGNFVLTGRPGFIHRADDMQQAHPTCQRLLGESEGQS